MKRAVPLMFVLAACSPIAVVAPKMTPTLPLAGADTCGANSFGQLIGADVEQLEKVLILKPVRVIHPDSAVTMDYLENRMNFYVNASDRVEAIGCG